MRIFLDANILVSVLNKVYPRFPFAARVVSLAGSKSFEVYTSPVCLAIAFYFAEKKSGTKHAKEKIDLLTQKIQIAETNKKAVLNALRNKKVNDFEDGLEYYSALNSKCKFIITEDTKDFYFSEIKVMNAHDFLLNEVL